MFAGSRRSVRMSRPSRTRSDGSLPPASAAKVGKKSIVEVIVSLEVVAGILPGHQAMQGTRRPPCQVSIL